MDTGRASSYAGLAGKTVFITGGGSGIGAAFTRAFAGQGARVGFVDIAEEASRGLVAQIQEERGGRVGCVDIGGEASRGVVAQIQEETGRAPLFIACDIRDIGALQAAIEKSRVELGDIGGLVNNGGNDARQTVEG